MHLANMKREDMLAHVRKKDGSPLQLHRVDEVIGTKTINPGWRWDGSSAGGRPHALTSDREPSGHGTDRGPAAQGAKGGGPSGAQGAKDPAAQGVVGECAICFISTGCTYSQHTVNIHSTYSQHTVNIQSTRIQDAPNLVFSFRNVHIEREQV